MKPTDFAPSSERLYAGRRAPATTVAATVAAVLAALASPLSRAADTDLPALQRQVDELQREIDRMKTQPVPAPAAAAEPSHSVPEAAKTAPMFYAGPVKVTLGGFVELMVIDRNRNESADWASNFNGSIPYPNSHQYDISEFHLSERQSRISALVEGPDGGSIHPAFNYPQVIFAREYVAKISCKRF